MKYHHLLILVFVTFLGASHYLGYTPIALGAIFLLSSLITYSLYAKDKAAAKVGSWRVSEKTLHLAALLCGWPGALIAQERLRHKTKKQKFRAVFWLSMLVNLGGIVWLHTSQGNIQFREVANNLESLVISNVPYETPVSATLFLTKFRTKEIEWLR